MSEGVAVTRSSAQVARDKFPQRPSASKQEVLKRRFQLTIPLRVPLKVRHYDILGKEVVDTTGLPAKVLKDVLYVTVRPGHMRAIPVINLIDITRLYA